jgi:hypothetical protein
MDHFEWDDLHGLSDPEGIAEQVGFQTPVISTWALHDSYDAYWEAIDQCTMHDQVGVPGLHAGGWFDHLSRLSHFFFEEGLWFLGGRQFHTKRRSLSFFAITGYCSTVVAHN